MKKKNAFQSFVQGVISKEVMKRTEEFLSYDDLEDYCTTIYETFWEEYAEALPDVRSFGYLDEFDAFRSEYISGKDLKNAIDIGIAAVIYAVFLKETSAK